MGMGVRRSPSSSRGGTDTESCYTHRLLLLFGWVQRLPGGGREGERGRHQAGIEGQDGARTGRGGKRVGRRGKITGMRVSDRQSQRGDGTQGRRGAKGGLGGWRQD